MLTQVLSRDSTDSLSMETPPNKHVYRPRCAQIAGYQHLGCIPQPGDEVAEDEDADGGNCEISSVVRNVKARRFGKSQVRFSFRKFINRLIPYSLSCSKW